MIRRRLFPSCVLVGAATLALSTSVRADVIVAEPATPIVPAFPTDAPSTEAQVVLQLVIDVEGRVESAVVVSRAPSNIGTTFDAAALDAVRDARFQPSTRDGRPFRSRVEYVVAFHPSPPSTLRSAPDSTRAEGAAAVNATANLAPFEHPREVEVRGTGWASPRGIGDTRIERDLLDASPRQQTSEMLSAAPGFFVDHEDGEGFGNDVYLRGFDLEHGSGIEMRVGSVPINSPVHVHGQGYADANFIIPEVVRSVRVLEGPYD
ncbi:MAG TPA: TonB family protein, partial [Polyangiaceae bacterium]|nr:TonB family protein [Polyangiaceae bacterium]